MKTILGLLLVTGLAYGQQPTRTVRQDSTPTRSLARIPTLRPVNDFYRNPTDADYVVRATLDNMPVKGVDSSTQYTIRQLYPQWPSHRSLPMLGRKPLPSGRPGKN